MTPRHAAILAAVCLWILGNGVAAGGPVTPEQLQSPALSEIACLGDRLFFRKAQKRGEKRDPNIYEIGPTDAVPRPLMSLEDADTYQPTGELVLRPGTRMGILVVSGQLPNSPAEMKRCLVLIDLESSSVTPLASNGRDVQAPAFSPDGHMVAFWSGSPKIAYTPTMEQKEGYALHVIDLQTSAERELVKADRFPIVSGSPAWSPDGKWIAGISAFGSTVRRIALVRPDGTGLQFLGTDIDPNCVIWPTNRGLLFTQYSKPGLSEMDVHSGKVRLVADGQFHPPLQLSPNGKFLKLLSYDGRGHRCVLDMQSLKPTQAGDSGLFLGQWIHPSP